MKQKQDELASLIAKMESEEPSVAVADRASLTKQAPRLSLNSAMLRKRRNNK